MFIGHFAPAFLARGISEDAPRLGVLFIGAQLTDWALFTLTLGGIEKLRIVPGITAMNPLDLYYMPYTHSLLGTALWAIGFAALIWLGTRSLVAASWAAFVVASHWVLDLLVHRPDLTLAGGTEKYGLGLWNFPIVAIPLELGLLLLAYGFYIARTKGPLLPPLILLAALLLFQALNWFRSEPEHAGASFSATAFLAFGILTALAFWVQSTRWHKNHVGLAVGSVQR